MSADLDDAPELGPELGPELDAAERPAAAQPLVLHIGLPKSGSTFLQSVLGANRALLREHGLTYPYVKPEGMFHAAVEMAGRAERWGLTPEEVRGTFDHLLRRGRRLGGTVVISHEIFSFATRKQLAVIAERLAEFDVRVVISVRNMGRTLTAEWQERVKNGQQESFQEYCDAIMSTLPQAEDKGAFWRSQNLHWVLERWLLVAPPERTAIVVCPSNAGSPDLLWQRFASSLDLDPGVVDLSQVPPGNESLGRAQIAFLRRVNAALDDRLQQPWYSIVAKRWFAQTLLSRVRSERPVTPGSVAEALTGVTRSWIERIERGGYVVHGDLSELLPEVPAESVPHPDEAAPAEMLEGLPEVVAEMLLSTGELRQTIRRLEAERDALAAARDRLAAEVAGLAAAAEQRSRWWPGPRP